MPLPKSVVIVGGSIAGLLHGLYLKRNGSDVVILEQDDSAMRSSYRAGIGFGAAAEELLRKYDATGAQTHATQPVRSRITYRKLGGVRPKMPRHYTSWGLLYRILRANFDGLASEAVPEPPPARQGDGRAEYRPGRRVTRLQYDQESGLVTVWFQRVGPSDGGGHEDEDALTAELVIGADGMHSTIRALTHAPAAKHAEYAGFVAWRGTVPESDLPPGTVEQLASSAWANLLGGSYLVSYVIPRDSGSFAPGNRLVNWLWYVVATSPAELAALLTDTAGRTHGSTVPAGLVRPAVWRRQLATALPVMAAPFAAAMGATRDDAVTVTRIRDVVADAASFHDGRVVLVGDALAAVRPHIAAATEQAARHCQGLARVWAGELTMQQWATEAVREGRRLWLLSRMVGLLGVGGWATFLKAIWAYVVFLVRLKLGRGPNGTA